MVSKAVMLANAVCVVSGAVAWLGTAALAAAQEDFERPPISYGTTTPRNAVETLQTRLDSGAARLEHDGRTGYLASLLAALDVPASSQTLVFSKTSLQQARITPRNPRALYFNDDVYIGYVRSGEVVEVSVADPELGAVFYTLAQAPAEKPRFIRQSDDCLQCHGSSQTRGVPGHVVRSVYPDSGGQPIFSAGSHRIDHTSPAKDRWGGWYVTGKTGAGSHLGNAIFRRDPGAESTEMRGLARLDLVPDDRFDAEGYLAATSDIVALSVLAHQAAAHNVLTRAGFDVRTALHREAALNRELGGPADRRWPSTDTVLAAAAESIVACFLFCDEAPLEGPIEGTTRFAAEFTARGPVDSAGRSLRDLDLDSKLLEHQCSYLIYTASFDALPEELRARFWQRMDDVLSGRDDSRTYAHLSAADRRAIREILVDTKPEARARLGGDAREQ
jgi:hypothetical protein